MKRPAILVDIDGTLAHMIPADKGGRDVYDYSRVHEDEADDVIADIVSKYECVIILTGREDDCRDVTAAWLDSKGIKHDELIMRPAGDHRPDQIVKWELYEQFVDPKYDIQFVLEDRNKVVKMWREKGLKCLQVAEGDF
jgi:hypothetical protein